MKGAAHSVNHMLPSYYVFFVILVVSHFGFEGGTLVLINQSLVIAYLILFKIKLIQTTLDKLYQL